MIRRSYFLVLVLVLLSACVNIGIKRKVSMLDDEITDYTVSLRWSMLDTIESYHKNKNGKTRPLDRSAMEDIRVTNVDLQEKSLNQDFTEAVVKGEVDYYRVDSGALKKLSITQNWWYDDKEKHWFIDGDYIKFK